MARRLLVFLLATRNAWVISSTDQETGAHVAKNKEISVEETRVSFLMQEYKFLQAEISAFIKQIWLVENAAITGTAAMYAWLLQYENKDALNKWIYSIPVFIAIFGFLRSRGLIIDVLHKSRYIQMLEQTIFQKTPLGWENEQNNFREKEADKLIRSGVWIWLALLFVSLFVSLLVRFAPSHDTVISHFWILILGLPFLGSWILWLFANKSVKQWKDTDAEIARRLGIKKRLNESGKTEAHLFE